MIYYFGAAWISEISFLVYDLSGPPRTQFLHQTFCVSGLSGQHSIGGQSKAPKPTLYEYRYGRLFRTTVCLEGSSGK